MRKIACSLLLLAFGSGQVFGQQKVAITIDGSNTVKIGSNSERELRVAITPSENFRVKRSPAVEQPIVAEVAFNSVRSSQLAKLFTPTWELAKDGTPLALKLSVDPTIVQPGKYSLILNLQPASNPTAPRLAIEIEQPAGELEVAPTKLVVLRTIYVPDFFISVQKMPLDIRETSKATALTNVSADWYPASLANGSVRMKLPDAAAIKKQCPTIAPDSSGTLPAGCGLKNIDYQLCGDFPLGDTSGSLRFFADQLTTPKSLDVEIQTRLSRWWLVIAIVPGLFLSYFLKFGLSKRIELNEARVKARELLSAIQLDLFRSPDHKFQVDLGAPIADLEKEVAKDDSQHIETQRQSTDQAWRRALDDLSGRLEASRKAYDEWRASTTASPPIPPTAQAALRDIQKQLDEALQQLNRRNASLSDEAMTSLSTTLLPQLRDKGFEWQDKESTLIDQLGSAGAGLPISVVKQFGDALKQAPADLKRLSRTANVSHPADAAKLIEDLGVEFAAVRDLLNRFALRLEQEWTEFSKTIDPFRGSLKNSSAFDAVRAEYRKFVGGLASAVNDPDAALKVLNSSLAELQSTWSNAFVANYPAASDQAIETLVHDQEFVKAGAALANLLAKKSGTILGTAPQPVPIQWPASAGLNAPTQPSVVVGSSTSLRIDPPPGFVALALAPEEQLKNDKIKQTVIVGVVLIGYLLFTSSQNYNGMWGDVWSAFLTALAADFALDSILSKFKAKS